MAYNPNYLPIPKLVDPGKPGPAWVDTFNPHGRRCRPHIRCQCGQVLNIGNHHVHPDGHITASFLHRYPDGSGCGWHVWLQLLDYHGLEFHPGQKD